MQKKLILIIALLISSSAFAATDHYFLRDGNDVQHVKITKTGDDITVSADVDFEPNASETNSKPCTADISGEAKAVSQNEIVLDKRLEGEARICTLKLHLTQNGVKIEQSEDCSYFATGLCRFSSGNKELQKIK